jgi:predicted SAM-dependent methyltransferase
MEKRLNLIIRGYLYKENRIPFHGSLWWPYTIDFSQVRVHYENLVKKLSKKYDVDVYFATYYSTPSEVLESLKDFPLLKDILLIDEKDSLQFSTAHFALSELSKKLTILIRSDLIMEEDFVSYICNHSYDDECVYVFSRSSDARGRAYDNVYDLVHVVHENKIDSFINDKIDRYGKLDECIDLHHIHNYLDVQYIVEHGYNLLPLIKLAPEGVPEDCSNAYCSRFWKIYRGKDYNPCLKREEIMRLMLSEEMLQKLKSKFDFSQGIKIDIGGGIYPREGFINCDILDDPRVDIQADFSMGIPLPDDFVDEVYSSHCLEHVPNVSILIRDIARICRVGASVTIKVPHFGQEMAMCPGHLHVISEHMIQHFDEFEEAWWHDMNKKLKLQSKQYIPTQWFDRAKQLFPKFADEDIYRFIQNTCHEVQFLFRVEAR